MGSRRMHAGSGPHVDCDVMILGASMAGIEVLHQLTALSAAPLRVVVIDRQREHGYIPLVQERLCERLRPAESTLDTARYVESVPGAVFLCEEIVGFDPELCAAQMASGRQHRARFAVIALGSSVECSSTIPGAEHLFAYKFGPEFERTKAALRTTLTAGDDRRIVVIGGGVSGVEMAGELASLRRHRPRGWTAPHVTLVSRGERLLMGHAKNVSKRALAALQAQGVDVRLGANLEQVHAHGVRIRENTGAGVDLVEVPADMSIWAGGVRPVPVAGALNLPRTSDGWLVVGPTMQSYPMAKGGQVGIFVCGDLARIESGQGRWATMQRAIECIWQAKVVARNIVTLAGEPLDYADGVPPLRPHVLRPTFFYGISLGNRSLVVYKRFVLNLPGVNHWFRRWLMRQYFARYASLSSVALGAGTAVSERSSPSDVPKHPQ